MCSFAIKPNQPLQSSSRIGCLDPLAIPLIIRSFWPLPLVGSLNYILCPHKAKECNADWLTLACPCVGVHWRT